MASRGNASIAAIVIALLVPVATIVLIAFGAINYVREYRTEHNLLRSEAALLADELSVSLQQPLWNFDQDQVSAVMNSVMRDPDIEALAVYFADTTHTVRALRRDPSWRVVSAVAEPVGAAGTVTEERLVAHGDANVGTVRILLTPRFADQRLHTLLVLTLSTVAVLDIALVLAVFVLLWRIVLRPLRLVETYAVGVSRGQRKDGDLSGTRFHGEVQRLSRAIGSMVGMLDSRFAALQTSEARLAGSLASLAERNAELTLLNDKLLQGELRYREIFETTSDGIFVVDVTADQRFRLVAYNPAQERMVGVPAESAVGRYVDEYFPSWIAEPLSQDNRACVAAGIPMTFERTLDLPVGRRFFTTTIIPVRDATGAIHRLIGVAHDVTDARRAAERQREQERQLFQAAKLASLGTLVSGIAHEINNPNNFIRLNVQNLAELWREGQLILDKAAAIDGVQPSVRGMDYRVVRGMVEDLLGGIEEGSRRIEKLLLNLRDFARGDEGDLTESVDLNVVIESGLTIIRNLIQKSARTFSFQPSHSLPCVRGNRQQIEQVVINLVTNACQALQPKGGTVTVKTSLDLEGRAVLLEVRDDGVGIPPANLDRVTDPFFTTRQAGGGTGLGLAVTSRIVQNHGGSIQFRSNEAAGTLVSVRLPVQN